MTIRNGDIRSVLSGMPALFQACRGEFTVIEVCFKTKCRVDARMAMSCQILVKIVQANHKMHIRVTACDMPTSNVLFSELQLYCTK